MSYEPILKTKFLNVYYGKLFKAHVKKENIIKKYVV